jgi:hypothetical protein
VQGPSGQWESGGGTSRHRARARGSDSVHSAVQCSPPRRPRPPSRPQTRPKPLPHPPCADPARWQSAFVRYNSQEAAAAGAPGWNLACSYQCVQQVIASDPSLLSASFSTAVAGGVAPTQVTMRILEAPAELCGPLRTDRRLGPGFRVRVKANYCRALDFPFTVKAYIIDADAANAIHE